MIHGANFDTDGIEKVFKTMSQVLKIEKLDHPDITL